MELPLDVFREIVEAVSDLRTLQAICLASVGANQIAQPYVFETIVIFPFQKRYGSTFKSLHASLSQRRPHFLLYTRTLKVTFNSDFTTEMEEVLFAFMDSPRLKVVHLSMRNLLGTRIPGSLKAIITSFFTSSSTNRSAFLTNIRRFPIHALTRSEHLLLHDSSLLDTQYTLFSNWSVKTFRVYTGWSLAFSILSQYHLTSLTHVMMVWTAPDGGEYPEFGALLSAAPNIELITIEYYGFKLESVLPSYLSSFWKPVMATAQASPHQLSVEIRFIWEISPTGLGWRDLAIVLDTMKNFISFDTLAFQLTGDEALATRLLQRSYDTFIRGGDNNCVRVDLIQRGRDSPHIHQARFAFKDYKKKHCKRRAHEDACPHLPVRCKTGYEPCLWEESISFSYI